MMEEKAPSDFVEKKQKIADDDSPQKSQTRATTLKLMRASDVSPSDLEECYKLVRKIRALYLSAGVPWSKSAKMKEMQAPGMWYLIAMPDQQERSILTKASTRHTTNARSIAGFASFVLDDVDSFEVPCIYLYEIHVQRNFQGLGIGKQLMERIVELAKERKLPINLTVFDFNKKAIQFYEMWGFSVVPLEDQRAHCLEMCKPSG